MSNATSKSKNLTSIKRQSVRVSPASLVATRPLAEGHRLLLLEPSADHIDLAAWAALARASEPRPSGSASTTAPSARVAGPGLRPWPCPRTSGRAGRMWKNTW